MKILHVITGLDVGGAETMLHRVATTMEGQGFTSRVVSLIPPGPMGDRLADDDIPVDSLNMRRGIPSPMALFRLMKILRDWRPDVVQTWLYHADLAGLLATRFAFPFGNGPKVVWNIRCSYMALDEYRRLTGATLTACARLSGLPDVVLTNSHEARRFHRELGYAPKRFEVIPNGFDTDRFRPDETARRTNRAELSIGDDNLVIGHTARFDAMKDHRTFIRAASQVAAADPKAVFLMVGRGVDYDNLELAAWMRESGLPPDRVRLLGEQGDMPGLMAAMDIHVSSSLGESFPNVVGESMACGVPNVVTDVGDSKRLVSDTGFVCPPGDAALLADAIIRLAAMPAERRHALGTQARKQVTDNYSLSSVVEQFQQLYKELSNDAL